MKRYILMAAAVLLLVFGAAAAHRWWFTPAWPEFAAAGAGDEPQVTYEVDTKRDYAFRIGDLVRVDMFVHQAPGTTVQVATPQIGGDYELSKLPEVTERPNQDGSVTYRVRLFVQSFEAKQKLSLQVSMGFQKSADAPFGEFKAKPLELYWGNTWDGVRKDLKEGDNLHPSPWGYWSRFGVPFGLGVALYVVLLVVAIVRVLRKLFEKTPEDALRAQFRDVLSRVKAGTAVATDHGELDSIVRQCWPVGLVPILEMDGSLSPVCKFLVLNAQGTYGEAGKLSDEDRQKLVKLGDKLLEIWGGSHDWSPRVVQVQLQFAEPAHATVPERIPLQPEDVPTGEQMAQYAPAPVEAEQPPVVPPAEASNLNAPVVPPTDGPSAEVKTDGNAPPAVTPTVESEPKK